MQFLEKLINSIKVTKTYFLIKNSHPTHIVNFSDLVNSFLTSVVTQKIYQHEWKENKGKYQGDYTCDDNQAYAEKYEK